VSTNSTAVAIKYLEELPAPFIVAKGKHELAAKMLHIAEEHGVEIANEPELSEALYEFEVGSFIPEQMYEIIAHILSHIMAARK